MDEKDNGNAIAIVPKPVVLQQGTVGNTPVELNYAGQDLKGMDLSAKDLTKADFTEADLRGTDFSDSDLSGAQLAGAKVSAETAWSSLEQIAVADGLDTVEPQDDLSRIIIGGAIAYRRYIDACGTEKGGGGAKQAVEMSAEDKEKVDAARRILDAQISNTPSDQMILRIELVRKGQANYHQ